MEYREREHREEGRSSHSLSARELQIAMGQTEAMRIQMWRNGLLRNFSGEITDRARPGGAVAGGVVKVGPWGGSGGQTFYMGGSGSGAGGAGAPRLLRVTLYHADAVHAFSFEYLLGGVRRTMGPSGERFLYGSKGTLATVRGICTVSMDRKINPFRC
jgi:hypothetical protein